MKKLIAILLSLCTILSIGSVASAATITETGSQSVKTTLTYGVDATYTVVIPDSVTLNASGEGSVTLTAQDVLLEPNIPGVVVEIDESCADANDRYTLYHSDNSDLTIKYEIFANGEKLMVKGNGDVALMAPNGTKTVQQTLQLKTCSATTSAGTYTGTLTFNVNLMEETKEMITFTLDGEQRQAEKGMTWKDWCNSEYNPGKYWAWGDVLSTEPGASYSRYCYRVDVNMHVADDDVIEANAAYECHEDVAHFELTIDGVTYETLDYIRWDDWCESRFNTGGFYADGKYIACQRNGQTYYLLWSSTPVLTAEYNIGANCTLGQIPEGFQPDVIFEFAGMGAGTPINMPNGSTFRDLFDSVFEEDEEYFAELYTIDNLGQIWVYGEMLMYDYDTGNPIHIDEVIKYDGFYAPLY